MTTITIQVREQTETGFSAIARIDQGTDYPIQIGNPFTPEQERDLVWYFEEWNAVAYLQADRVRAERVAASIPAYGAELFRQVFKTNFDLYGEYRNCRGHLSQVEFEIVGEAAEFQALHWEMMRDPELPYPFAVDCVMTRRRNWLAPVKAEMAASPVINVLLVTARPKEEQDLGYRTTSRPLLAALQNAQLPVNLVLLRPGTYEALERHLQEVGEGFYHIIHFDAHGGVGQYDLLENLASHQRMLLKGRYGRSDLQPFAGKRAFLLLESEEAGKSDPVAADELANLLTGKQIPICILDACQLGQELPEGEGAASLGSQLMAAGMLMVVAMRYSVLASAAGMLMGRFYQALVENKPLPQAMQLGRRELYQQKGRRAYYNFAIELEDWILPVVYRQQAVRLNLRPFTPQEAEVYYAQLGQAAVWTEPTYGFVGRDLEILKIEKALLRRNILLVQGMGGTGKTTLLKYLAHWWRQTNFVRQVFYFGYDEKAWTLEQILFAIGQAVYDRYEQASFQAMPLMAQVGKLVATLRSQPYALILDNLESVTGQALAIQNTLPEAEQAKLRDFLVKLRGGKTYGLLGSRSGEDWLAAAIDGHIYGLKGLDPQSRSELAEKILQRQVPGREAAIRQDKAFGQLMQLLAGYPLAMEVVLANLARQSPAEVLKGLDAADIQLDRESEDKTQSLIKCIDYSHQFLSPEAQQLLVCLAPFSGFISRLALSNYVEQLQALEPFQDYPLEHLDEAVQEAIDRGLLEPIDQFNPDLLTIQPVFPYYLKTKLRDWPSETQAALQEGFKNHYRGLAGYYYQLMNSKEAQERQMGIAFCRLEYENLYHALETCLAQQESVRIFFCLDKYLELMNDRQSALKLSEFVSQHIANYPPEFLASADGDDVMIVMDRLAKRYLLTQDYAQARATYERDLHLIPQIDCLDDRQKGLAQARTYHQLGWVAQELREFEAARQNYQQALQIFVEFNDRYEQASTYHQLGIVAQELREFEAARQNYQQALQIFVEFNDRYSQASTYHQLGRVAEELREFEAARQNYQQALQIKIEFNDRYSQAMTYHQLGRVAQELREFEVARQNYQQALQIYVEFNDRYSQASTYHQLGNVTYLLREFEAARQNYQQALQIKIEFNDRYEQASTYHQLGMVAEDLREFEVARQNYQQALQIFVEFNDRYSQASTYHQLGIVAQELREFEVARQNYQQALQIFVEFNDRYEQAGTYHQLGIVAQGLREFEAARQNYQQALQIFVEFNDRYSQASTYGQLGLLAAAEGNDSEAEVNLQQALAIFVEFGDEYNAEMARRNLARIADNL